MRFSNCLFKCSHFQCMCTALITFTFFFTLCSLFISLLLCSLSPSLSLYSYSRAEFMFRLVYFWCSDFHFRFLFFFFVSVSLLWKLVAADADLLSPISIWVRALNLAELKSVSFLVTKTSGLSTIKRSALKLQSVHAYWKYHSISCFFILRFIFFFCSCLSKF